MKQNQFVQHNQVRWQSFETDCQNEKEALPDTFPASYRQICADLATAKTRHYSPALVEKLNQLVLSGQSRLYVAETLSFKQVLSVFAQSVPKALHENRYYIWGATLAFYGLALVAYIWVQINPEAVYYFMQPSNVASLEAMYNPSGAVQSETRGVDSDLLMFGVYIYNNIGIAFQMFGGGAMFCIGALFPLLFNSFYFGAVSGHIVNVGFEQPFFSFVITHGSFELTAIVIAGAAGCRIGMSLLNPGRYSRAYAIKEAGKKVLPLVVACFVMLVIAAFVEAFWSPRDIAAEIKYVVGSLCWALVLYRLYKGTCFGT